MNITVAKKDLLPALARVQGVTKNKSPQAILQCAMLSSTDKGLRVSGTDLLISTSSEVEAITKTRGAIGINARTLLDRVKSLPDGPITIETNDKQAVIKSSGARKHTVPFLSGDDFPSVPMTPGDAVTQSIPAAMLAGALTRIVHAISLDEGRTHLHAAQLQWEGDTLRIDATDGHRLAKLTVAMPGRSNSLPSMLLSRNTVEEARRMLGDAGTKDCVLAVDNETVFLEVAGITLSAKLVNAQFPPTDQVIPKNCAHYISVPRAAMIESLRAIGQSSDAVKGDVTLSFRNGKVRISSESATGGASEDELDVECSATFRFAVRASYLVDSLESVDTEMVEFGAGSELDPVVVRSPGASDGFLGVVMPMRI